MTLGGLRRRLAAGPPRCAPPAGAGGKAAPLGGGMRGESTRGEGGPRRLRDELREKFKRAISVQEEGRRRGIRPNLWLNSRKARGRSKE